MSNQLQLRCIILWAACSLILIMFPACTSAHPEEHSAPKQDISSTTDGSFQIKKRPTYINQQIEEMLKMRMAGQKMREPYPPLKRVFYTTPDEANKAFSIGDTRDGYMINGQPLPSPSLLIRQHPVQYERGLIYGTQNLIKVLVETAQAMQK